MKKYGQRIFEPYVAHSHEIHAHCYEKYNLGVYSNDVRAWGGDIQRNVVVPLLILDYLPFHIAESFLEEI